MMKSTKKLEGIIPALITPLTENGSVDFTVLEKQVAYLSEAGVHGFFVNGSTAEGPYLTTKEKVDILKCVKDISAGKQFLCAACLQASTSLVLEELKAFEPLEPDFIVAVTPYYYSASQDIIKAHYQEILQQTKIPVILYNIPQCTYNKMEYDTMVELAASGQFVGLKDSSGDFITFSRAVYSGPFSDFAWIQGEDLLDGPSLLIGADGIVTGLGNIWIDPYIRLYQAKQQKNFEQMNDIQKQINALFEIIKVVGGKVISAIQAGTMLCGRSHQWMKIPGMTLAGHEIVKIKKVLEDLGIL